MEEMLKILTIRNVRRDYDKMNYVAWNLDRKFSKEICLKAEIEHEERKAEMFGVWKINILNFDNQIFNECRVINGISKNQFLKRFLIYRPVSNTVNVDCFKQLTKLCNALDKEEIEKRSFIQLSDTLDKLCSIFATPEWRGVCMEWIESFSKTLWTNIAYLLDLKDNLIVPDVCIATAFIVFTIGHKISERIIFVFTKLVTLVQDCCKDLDEYVITYSDASEEYLAGRQLIPFYFPPFKSNNINYMLLSSAFYSETFIINTYLSEDLYDEFLPLIDEMADVSKFLHLNLLTLVIEKIRVLVDDNINQEELVTFVEHIYEHTTNLRIDRNHANKIVITDINNTLKNILQIYNPNSLVKFRRRSSNDMKLFISLRKNKNDKDEITKLSVASTIHNSE